MTRLQKLTFPTSFALPRLLPAALLLLAGCPTPWDGGFGGEGHGGTTSTASTTGTGGTTSAASTTGTGGTGGTGGTTSTSSGGSGGSTADGPMIRIHMRANTKPFPHNDWLAGETPIQHSSGLRRFQLFKDAADPNPVTVFDYGPGFVEAGYNDGDDTIVATVPVASIPEGVYTRGRTVHSHVRFQVDATAHVGGLAIPGYFDNVEVMSDNTLFDGTLRHHGWFTYTFHYGTESFAISGDNGPVPEFLSSGGFEVTLENGEWAYEYPLNLPVVHAVTKDVDTVMEVNMFESFRWQDLTTPGFTTGVFDVTPTGFEPVLRFGANSFSVYLE